MNIHFFSSPFSQKVIQAFSWTLIHSLWQGLILAVLTGILLLLTRKSRPALRYNLLAGLLVGFIITGSATFYLEYRSLSKSVVSLRLNKVPSAGLLTNIQLQTHSKLLANQLFLVKEMMSFCSQNASIIVTIWFLILMLKSMKAATGLYYIHHILRRNRIHAVDEVWKQIVNELAKKLHVKNMVQMFESEIVQIPMVMGFLKPIILVPLGFLTNLPFNQVEAILLHELAHIKRKDYLVNLFQSFAENVFFFNPAVLWISYLIREEREHCCDDLAIGITQNKKTFVNALVVFQEYKIAGSAHSLAFAGKRNHLLDRVKRIIYNNNKQLDAMEKLFVTASLITVAALSVAFSPTPILKTHKNQQVQEKSLVVRPSESINHEESSLDTLPSKTNQKESNFEYHEFTKDNKHYEITRRNGEISELEIDGKVIPKEKFAAYKLEIGQLLEEVKAQQENAEIERGKADVLRQEADVQRQEADKMRRKADDLRKSTDELRVQADEMRKQAGVMRVEAEKIKENVNANQNIAGNVDELRKQADLARKDADKSRLSADELRAQAEVMRKQADEMRAKADVSRMEADKMRAEYEKLQSDLINDLIKEGVIKDEKNLSYKLSNDELIVNGVKQSDQLLAKLKSKYIKDKSVEMVYNFKGKTGYTTTGMIYTR